MLSHVSEDFNDIPICRSYQKEVQKRLLGYSHIALEGIGDVRYGSHAYPLLLAHYPPHAKGGNPTAFLSGDVHGDELGVYAILDFLEQGIQGYGDRCNFIIAPCVNPSGFEAGTRETMNGKDLNRIFGTGSDQEEVRALERWLKERSPYLRLAIDCHESGPRGAEPGFTEADNPRAAYLYETMPDVRRRIGRVLMDLLPDEDICHFPTIYGEKNDHGVVSYPEGCAYSEFLQSTNLDAYLHSLYAEHTFTLETPTVWSLEKRIAVQLLWLRRALDLTLSQG